MALSRAEAVRVRARPPGVTSLWRQSTSHNATTFCFSLLSSVKFNAPRAPMPTNARLSFSLGGVAPGDRAQGPAKK